MPPFLIGKNFLFAVVLLTILIPHRPLPEVLTLFFLGTQKKSMFLDIWMFYDVIIIIVTFWYSKSKPRT